MSRIVLVGALLGLQLVSGQTWCGKNYKHNSPIVPPGGNFGPPGPSSFPLLAFRCSPGVIPYLPSDASSGGTLLVDAFVTNSQLAGAFLLKNTTASSYQLTAMVDGIKVASGSVPANSTKYTLPLSLRGLKTSSTPLDLECTLTTNGQTFTATSKLSYLPNNKHGSITKRDIKTGALLARGTNGEGPYAPVFPVGFYTNFGGYLADNLTILDDIKAQGFTVVHPTPTFDNLTALDLVIDRMEELGLWLMYDMRWTYMNLTAVQVEVSRIMSRPNLLLWYTADEPDGTGDPLNATVLAYDKIYELDKGYHPVSLVLNCQDYYYEEYASGADILLQDTYTIGNNVTWSSQFNTPCTPDYGDCGCDNCHGNLTDISDRMDDFAQRNLALGWELNKSVWTVPQGFGNETYWKRYPTGKEFIVQSALGINHGAKGVVSWNNPTTADIQSGASQLAQSSVKFASFLFSPTASFNQYFVSGVDVGVWKDPKLGTFVLATNTAYVQATVPLIVLGLKHWSKLTMVLDSGAKVVSSNIVLDGVGTGGFVLST